MTNFALFASSPFAFLAVNFYFFLPQRAQSESRNERKECLKARKISIIEQFLSRTQVKFTVSPGQENLPANLCE
jgi:hypothetical protein